MRKKGLAASNSGRGPEVALSAAKAGVSSAQAGLDNAQAELDRTEIVAKVGGIVQEPVATAGSMLAMGAPCASIVQARSDGLCRSGARGAYRIGQDRT
ncbi:hypothetical protein PSQ19_00890 [Devosia algicola]|uniref:Uncharacterized protein n=1 Tax=Devosia algicola TaxID=3026418 RepID=A0ABY7YT23_9HYPH|nr:hypothetical protein [Devosia algicola]WDR04399.1 hypothetical protein PSQ19_00890 [Devosia algicola]